MRYVLAPLAGFTDAAFRRLCFEGGADFAYTEMVSAAGLAHGSSPTRQLMETMPGEGALGCQIFGANESDVAYAAGAVPDRFSEINLNAGCPVRKVVKEGAGAKLAEDPEKVYRLLRAMKGSTRLPVTLKTRLGPRPDRNLSLELLDAADHGVELAVARALREVDAVVIQELELARGSAALVGSAVGARRFGRGGSILRRGRVLVEETVEEREGRGLAVVLIRVVVGRVGVGIGRTVAAEHAHAAEHFRHIAGEIVEIGVRDAELFHHLIDGLDVQLARTAQAQALVMGLAIFDSCDKDHRYVFLAAGAECRLHSLVLLFDRFPCTPVTRPRRT